MDYFAIVLALGLFCGFIYGAAAHEYFVATKLREENRTLAASLQAAIKTGTKLLSDKMRLYDEIETLSNGGLRSPIQLKK